MWPASATVNSRKSLVNQRAPHSQLFQGQQHLFVKTQVLLWTNRTLFCGCTEWDKERAVSHAGQHITHLIEHWQQHCHPLMCLCGWESAQVAAMIQQCLQGWSQKKVCPYPRRLTGQRLLAGILWHRAVTYTATSLSQLKSFKTKHFKIKYWGC